MPYKSLADFLEELAAAGELVRVSAEVDPQLEIAEITRRVAEQGGPALLFDRIRGQSMAVVTNLLGTEARACRALELESLDAMPERIESLLAEHTPQNWFDRLKMSGDSAGADKFRPKSAKTGPVQQVVHLGRDVHLASFPLLKSWAGESGPSLTAGLLVSEALETQQREVTPATLVALDENRLAIAGDGASRFARQWAVYQAAGQRMPVAIAVGGDPAIGIAAHLELPAAVDVLHVAGLLRGKAIETVKCRTHAVEIPAEADLVLEGYLDPETPPAAVQVGGAGGGYFRAISEAPVVHVAAITHRSRPILPAIIDGSSGEASILSRARERMLLPALRAVAPDIVDVHLPSLGGKHRFAFVSIDKRAVFQARQVAAALWGTAAVGQVTFLVIVDSDVDLRDARAVLDRIGTHALPERDVIPFDGPAREGVTAQLARRLAFDATVKWPDEQGTASLQPLDAGEAIRELVSARWAEYQLPGRPG